MQNDNQAAIKEMLKSFAYLLDEAKKQTTKIYSGVVVSATSDLNKWIVKYNGKNNIAKLYGNVIPAINSIVKVFVPQGNESLAWFFINSDSGGGTGGITEAQAEAIAQNVFNESIIPFDERLSNLEYEPINILSFSSNIVVAELGNVIENITLSYNLNKLPVELLLNNNPVPISTQTNTIQLTNLSLSQSFTWSLKATDERDATSTKSTTLNFYNGIYYGASASDWQSLNKRLSNNLSTTFTANAGVGEYIWYAFPSRLGTPTFFVGGFEGGFSLESQVAFTNDYNYTEQYSVYRSDNSNLGNTTVVVQ